jgi:hypothetical protein
MSTKLAFRLINKEIRDRAVSAVKEAENGMVVVISGAKRSLCQNDKFHAICRDLERSGVEWAGSKRKADEWKLLLVSAHDIATNSSHGYREIVGIEGELVPMREHTSSMTKDRMNSLIEYAEAFYHTFVK